MKKFFLRTWHEMAGLEEITASLLRGQHRHDVLEYGIRAVELDTNNNSVGLGGAPNLLGRMELDAAFIDGDTRNVGVVGGVENYLPVRIARRVMESELHTALIADGAERFAAECGLPMEPTLTEEQRALWEKNVAPLVQKHGTRPLIDLVKQMSRPADENLDTTIMFASDGQGLSGAASTAGWSYKHPGRLGDTPIIGAGMYVDSRFGACACTHTGEMAMRGGTARFVVAMLQAGKSVREAIDMAVEDIAHLQNGVLRALVIHAIDTQGNANAVAINADHQVYYYYWNQDMMAPERRLAEAVTLPHRPKVV